MIKIDGKYKNSLAEDLLVKINGENSITKRHRLIDKYLYQRLKQLEIIIANLEDDDIDLTLVIEQLWNDLSLAQKQIGYTLERSDFYADYYNLKNKIMTIETKYNIGDRVFYVLEDHIHEGIIVEISISNIGGNTTYLYQVGIDGSYRFFNEDFLFSSLAELLKGL